MSTRVNPRVPKEFKKLKKEVDNPKNGGNEKSLHSVVLDEKDNYTKWTASFHGPADTPYEGGVFYVGIEIPSQYPFNPPKMKFLNKVWHPNISSQTGAICLDILKNEWSPALTIRTALISLQALLSTPEPDDPQDALVAQQYKTKREEFNQTAKLWTKDYAVTKPAKNEEKTNINTVIEILKSSDCTKTYNEEKAKTLLFRYGWNPAVAATKIMNDEN